MKAENFELIDEHDSKGPGHSYCVNLENDPMLMFFHEGPLGVWMAPMSKLAYKAGLFSFKREEVFTSGLNPHITPTWSMQFAQDRGLYHPGLMSNGTAAAAGLAPQISTSGGIVSRAGSQAIVSGTLPPSAPPTLFGMAPYNYTDWQRDWMSTPVEDQSSKCDCGSEKTYGEGTNLHSHWCSKADKS